jgi:hypothetical protein
MFGLNFISPKLGVKLIRGQIEKQLKEKVPFFDMVFISDKNQLQFVANGKFYNFSSDELKKMIEKLASKQLKKFQSLDVVCLKVNEQDEINVIICYTEGTEKLKLNYKL